MTTRELNLDGVRTPLREAGPADASEAVVFVHGNPGSGAGWVPSDRGCARAPASGRCCGAATHAGYRGRSWTA